MGNRVGRLVSFLVVFVGLSVWGAAIVLSQTLSLDDQTAAAIGERVTFTLSIDYPSSESGEISNITIDVDFDQAVLSYDSHAPGALVANWDLFDVSSPQDQEGKLLIAGLAFTPGEGIQPGESGAIVQLHFIVDDMADATLTMSAKDQLAAFDTRNGQFMFAVNTPPVASDDMATTEEDTPAVVDVLANDTDADGDSLTITAVTQGSNGAVAITGNGATVTYTPNAGFAGEDEFTYTITDGTSDVTAGVMVTVTEAPAPANTPPVASDDMATIIAASPGAVIEIDVLANDTDADGDSLTITSVTQGSNGAVAITGNGATVIYTPDAGFTGEDEFMYTVSDGEAAATASVFVDVARVSVPVASDDMATTEEDTPVVVDVLANDADSDGDSLTITAVTQGNYGAVAITGNGATVTYTPDAGFAGEDEFTYTITDGTSDVTAGVMVTVTEAPAPANTPPVASDDMATTDAGKVVMIDVLANDADADGDGLTITAVTQGNHGAVAITGNGTTVTYAPSAGFAGEDEFMYTVSDGEAADTASVFIDVESVYGGGGGGCTLNPGARFDPTLIVALISFLGIHVVRQRLTRRQSLR